MAEPDDRIAPEHTRGFAWPPRRPAQQRSAAADGGDVPGAASHLAATQERSSDYRRTAWEAFEAAFLDVAALPLHVRSVEAGWMPDRPGRYCPRCGRGVESVDASTEGCRSCAGVVFAWDRLVRLGEYAGPLRRWIHEIKFTRWRRLGEDLGELLGESLREAAGPLLAASSQPPVLVAVPDSGVRRVWRGIDHAAVITRGVARVTGWPVARPLSRRIGRSQLAVPSSERAGNVAKSFAIRKGASGEVPQAGPVVVVDDIITTGATMRTCCRLITSACQSRSRGARPVVWAACLGRAELGSDRSAGVGRDQRKGGRNRAAGG